MSRIKYDRANRCVRVRCTECGAEHSFKCNRTVGELFESGEFWAYSIDRLIPNVSADIREMFITGWCGKCWDERVGEEEEEE